MKRTGTFAAIVLVAVLGLPVASAAAPACTWRPHTLDSPGTSRQRVEATDHNGGYSGTASFGDGDRRIVSWKDGRFIDHGGSEHGAVRVVDQNASGTIAATSTTGLWGEQVISFRIRDGRRETLPSLPDATQYPLHSRAFGIADNDDVYGTNYVSRGGTGSHVIVRWPGDRPGEVEEVQGLPEDIGLVDVDHDGTLLVGPGSTYRWPHLWRDGVLTRLPEPPGTQHGYARAVADLYVAGSIRQDGPNHAAYWDRNGKPHVLAEGGEATHINSNGLMITSGNGINVYRLTRFEARLSDTRSGVFIGTVGDDDSVGGARTGPGGLNVATVWRCG